MAEHTRLLAGEAGERRLTAGEVRRTVFPSSGFIRGLNSEQVTLFMRRVAAELDLRDEDQAGMIGERTDLEEEIARLRQENSQLRAQAAPVNGSYSPGLPPPEQQAVHMLRRAQENADHLLADAQVQARHLMADGHSQRERMLADGHTQRRRVITEAVEEAGREAARIAAQAPIDAQRQYARYQGLADAIRASLDATLQGLQAQMRSWDEQERQSPPPLPQRVPTGPQPTA